MDIFLRWIGGILTGAAWSTINFLLILNILKIALLRENKAKLFIMLLVKFPVLYIVGFLILFSKIFPILSVLCGVVLVLVVMGVIKLCPRRNQSCPNCQTR
jgi:fatty acid desaturase